MAGTGSFTLKHGLSRGTFIRRLQELFPDREFFMRSQGHVRFIKITSRMQIIGVAIVALALLVWIGTIAGMTISQFVSRADRLELIEREARAA